MNSGTNNNRFLAGLVLSLLSFAGFADDAPAPLPQPLTLEYALSLAEEPHPEMLRAEAAVQRAQAQRLQARSLTGVSSTIGARARWVGPADVAPDQSDDHMLNFVVRKQLYDFGRSARLTAAADAEIRGQEFLYLNARERHRLEIMRRFLDVLIADLEFARDNENMAVVFVSLDRLRDRHELGQVSDIVLLEKESEYQEVRRKRLQSLNRQRATRARLAEALNRPGQLPSVLAAPSLPDVARAVPELEELQAAAREGNPVLLGLRQQVEAATQRTAAARAIGRPLLTGELEAATYSRSLGGYDDWRAGVLLQIPLTTGGLVQAQVAEQQAELQRVTAELRQSQREVEQAVLEGWLELQALQIARDEAAALREFRNLYLDRSRALYEMEVRTDLGDAMVRLTEAQLREAQADYELALAWARMDALLGRARQ